MKAWNPVLLALATFFTATSSFKIPSCGVERCLDNGVFYGCDPSDLVCLCDREQSCVNDYAATIKPCLDSPDRKAFCTDGALYDYEDLLTRVCKDFGNTIQL